MNVDFVPFKDEAPNMYVCIWVCVCVCVGVCVNKYKTGRKRGWLCVCVCVFVSVRVRVNGSIHLEEYVWAHLFATVHLQLRV